MDTILFHTDLDVRLGSLEVEAAGSLVVVRVGANLHPNGTEDGVVVRPGGRGKPNLKH